MIKLYIRKYGGIEMDKKKIPFWTMIFLIGLIVAGCAGYAGNGYYEYPDDYGYYYGYPYYGYFDFDYVHPHGFGEHHEFAEHHGFGEHHGFEHHEGGEHHR